MRLTLKQTTVAFVLCLLLVPSLSFAFGKSEFSRSFSEAFSTNADVSVSLYNKYGDIDVISTNENKVSIDVKITVEASSLEKANKLLDKITISIDGDKSTVNARTSFAPKSNFNGLQIDYIVKLPKTARLNLENKFGDVVINQLDGPTKIHVGYGAFRSGNLNNKQNDISIDFGQGSIAYATYLDLTIKYTDKMHVKKVKLLELNSQFSEVHVGAVGRMNITSAYDEIEVTAGAEVFGSLKFSEISITAITSKVDLKSQYGDIDIEKMDEDFELCAIEVKFCDANIEFSSNSQFSVNGKVSFGDFRYDDDYIQLHVKEGNTSATFNGSSKRGSGSATVTVNGSYGDIHLDTY